VPIGAVSDPVPQESGPGFITRVTHRFPVTYFRGCFDPAAPLLGLDLRRFGRPMGKARTRRPRRCSSLRVPHPCEAGVGNRWNLGQRIPSRPSPTPRLRRGMGHHALPSAHRSLDFHRSPRQVFSYVGLSSNPEGSAPVACAAAVPWTTQGSIRRGVARIAQLPLAFPAGVAPNRKVKQPIFFGLVTPQQRDQLESPQEEHILVFK